MFWTDMTQAQERLPGTVVCYDKKPCYIDNIQQRQSGEIVAESLLLGGGGRHMLPLEDEKWNNFRDLPKLGWFNYLEQERGRIVPVFLERRAVNSRQHGLSSNNVLSLRTTPQGVDRDRYYNLTEYLKSPGYQETMHNDENFPKLSEILMALDDSPSAVAFSPRFCVVVTEEGMKWLFRKQKRIGFFTGTDSLNLFPRNGFYKEELQAVPAFDINNVREF